MNGVELTIHKRLFRTQKPGHIAIVAIWPGTVFLNYSTLRPQLNTRL